MLTVKAYFDKISEQLIGNIESDVTSHIKKYLYMGFRNLGISMPKYILCKSTLEEKTIAVVKLLALDTTYPIHTVNR